MNRQIVAKDHLLFIVNINDGCQRRFFQAKIIEEARVLMEGIGVGLVIHGAIFIAEKKDDPGV